MMETSTGECSTPHLRNTTTMKPIMKNILYTLTLLWLLTPSHNASAQSAIGESAPTAVSQRIQSLYRNPPNDLITYTYKIPESSFWVVVIKGGELLVVSDDGNTLVSLERSALDFSVFEKGKQGYVNASSKLSQSYSAKKLPPELRSKLSKALQLKAFSKSALSSQDLEATLSRSYNFYRARRFWMIQAANGKVVIDSDTGLVFMTSRERNVASLLVVNANSDIARILNDDVKSQSIKDAVNAISKTIDFVSPTEHTVRYVFTDPLCGYCRKLHTQIADLNERGITIRYIPINNFGDRSLEPVLKLLAVEPEKQPKAVSYMKEQLSSRKSVDYKVIGSPIVTPQTRDQLRLNKTIGDILGVKGTPAIFDTSGKSSTLN